MLILKHTPDKMIKLKKSKIQCQSKVSKFNLKSSLRHFSLKIYFKILNQFTFKIKKQNNNNLNNKLTCNQQTNKKHNKFINKLLNKILSNNNL